MRFRPPVLGAIAAAIITSSLVLGPAGGAVAADPPDDSAPSRPLDEGAQQRQLAFGQEPKDVHVETDTDGYVVYGTPMCTGWGLEGCKSAIAQGTDASHSPRIDTKWGYRISWPSGWREGESRAVGNLFSVAKDWIGWWYDSRKGVSLGSVTRPYAFRSITATVTSKNDGAKTAEVSGSGTPGAEIRLGGTRVATVDTSGRWSHHLTGLTVGVNSRTYAQYVDGARRDQKTVTVTITEPDQPDLITGQTGTATLTRGGAAAVDVTYTPKRAFTTPSGSLTLVAPEGTTFATGQDSQRGEYLQGGSWFAFAGNSLVDGQRSGDGRTYTFSLGQRNWDVAAGQEFRFSMRVDTPADTAMLSGEMTGRLTGRITGGTFDTTARTVTTVPDRAVTAEVRSVDATARSAVVGGDAPFEADRIELTWRRDGAEERRSVGPAAGSWQGTVDGLEPGGNPVQVAAFRGSNRLGSTSVDVDVPAPTFDGGATFDPDVTKPVQVGGHGTPGATVVVRESGNVLRRTTVTPGGTWSVTLPAPDRGGVRTVQAEQTGSGVTPQAIDVRIDYGEAVATPRRGTASWSRRRSRRCASPDEQLPEQSCASVRTVSTAATSAPRRRTRTAVGPSPRRRSRRVT